jgi:hypothetical protein
MRPRRIDHPRFRDALREVENSIDTCWQAFREELGVTAGTPDERTLAETVMQDPSEFDWRIVDGALKHLTCNTCGSGLGTGPLGCPACDQANGYRFAGREVDRPGVPAGNEHALRVSSAVARTRDRYTPRARCGYELFLPDLLAGALPTTVEAQRGKALINALTDDDLEHLITLADLV